MTDDDTDSDQPDNLAHLPSYENMPSEIAAFGLPDDDDVRIVINRKEERRLSAFRHLRPGVLIPVLYGSTIEPIVRRLQGHQVAAAVAGTAVVTTAALVGLNLALDGNEQHLAQPPAPVITITTTVETTAQTPPSSPARTLRPTRSVTPSLAPTRATGTRPPATSSTKATTAPPETPASPTQTRTSSESRPEDGAPSPPAEAPPTPQPTPAPSPSPGTTGPPASAPTATAHARDCAIQVDLNPLLELCLLS